MPRLKRNFLGGLGHGKEWRAAAQGRTEGSSRFSRSTFTIAPPNKPFPPHNGAFRTICRPRSDAVALQVQSLGELPDILSRLCPRRDEVSDGEAVRRGFLLRKYTWRSGCHPSLPDPAEKGYYPTRRTSLI